VGDFFKKTVLTAKEVKRSVVKNLNDVGRAVEKANAAAKRALEQEQQRFPVINADTKNRTTGKLRTSIEVLKPNVPLNNEPSNKLTSMIRQKIASAEKAINKLGALIDVLADKPPLKNESYEKLKSSICEKSERLYESLNENIEAASLNANGILEKVGSALIKLHESQSRPSEQLKAEFDRALKGATSVINDLAKEIQAGERKAIKQFNELGKFRREILKKTNEQKNSEGEQQKLSLIFTNSRNRIKKSTEQLEELTKSLKSKPPLKNKLYNKRQNNTCDESEILLIKIQTTVKTEMEKANSFIKKTKSAMEQIHAAKSVGEYLRLQKSYNKALENATKAVNNHAVAISAVAKDAYAGYKKLQLLSELRGRELKLQTLSDKTTKAVNKLKDVEKQVKTLIESIKKSNRNNQADENEILRSLSELSKATEKKAVDIMKQLDKAQSLDPHTYPEDRYNNSFKNTKQKIMELNETVKADTNEATRKYNSLLERSKLEHGKQKQKILFARLTKANNVMQESTDRLKSLRESLIEYKASCEIVENKSNRDISKELEIPAIETRITSDHSHNFDQIKKEIEDITSKLEEEGALSKQETQTFDAFIRRCHKLFETITQKVEKFETMTNEAVEHLDQQFNNLKNRPKAILEGHFASLSKIADRAIAAFTEMVVVRQLVDSIPTPKMEEYNKLKEKLCSDKSTALDLCRPTNTKTEETEKLKGALPEPLTLNDDTSSINLYFMDLMETTRKMIHIKKDIETFEKEAENQLLKLQVFSIQYFLLRFDAALDALIKEMKLSPPKRLKTLQKAYSKKTSSINSQLKSLEDTVYKIYNNYKNNSEEFERLIIIAKNTLGTIDDIFNASFSEKSASHFNAIRKTLSDAHGGLFVFDKIFAKHSIIIDVTIRAVKSPLKHRKYKKYKTAIEHSKGKHKLTFIKDILETGNSEYIAGALWVVSFDQHGKRNLPTSTNILMKICDEILDELNGKSLILYREEAILVLRTHISKNSENYKYKNRLFGSWDAVQATDKALEAGKLENRETIFEMQSIPQEDNQDVATKTEINPSF